MIVEIVILAIIKQSAMSEEEEKTDGEEKTIPRAEGYTIVKYAKGWADAIWIFGMIVSIIICCLISKYINAGLWLELVIYICACLIFVFVAHKITEVKVNLKITEEGLEQTRISGSKQYPKHRMIKWEDMKSYHLCGRSRDNDFLISVKDDVNFRICIPWPALFEKEKDNWENFAAFQDDFWGIAPEHDVHRAFFG